MISAEEAYQKTKEVLLKDGHIGYYIQQNLKEIERAISLAIKYGKFSICHYIILHEQNSI